MTVGKISSLFGTLPIASGYPYDVSADGRRFLTTIPPDGATSADLTVVQNWAAALKRH